jgi:TetR/AcrR family transcriptional regulator, regulator of autoinduction and epiphytic fitness
MTIQAEAGGTPIDGRTARRDRNRDLVLDAVLELFADNQLAPNAADVAARSGVSLRSVYRYYEDFDELVRAAIARHAERVAPLIEIPDPGQGPFEERVNRFVEHRMRLYEASAPLARAALVRAPANRLVRDQANLVRERLGRQTREMFAPELTALPAAPRRALGAAADSLTQFESAEHLRVRLGFSSAQTADILRRSLTALLTNSA